MKISAKIFVVLCVLSFGFGNAQKKNVIKKASQEFSDYSYIDAQEDYLKLAEEGYKSEELFKGLGDSYYFTADYVNAATWYTHLYDFMNLTATPEYLYRYAQTLKSTEQYNLSDKIMKEYRKAANLPESSINSKTTMKDIDRNSGRYEVQNVTFNSTLSDFAPSFKDNKLVFASNRFEGTNPKKHNWNDQPFFDLYTVQIAEAYGDETPEKMSKVLNTQYHESSAVFTKDSKTVYFTRNNYTKYDYETDQDGTNRLKLYRGRLNEKGKWKIKELPFNSDEFSVAHPALSVDETTLYFASDMPGGLGESDLYKIAIEGDGFGTPINLGKTINTEFRDTFPFIADDNKLYFASEGHQGLGGLDVFVTDLVKTSNTGIKNLGRPINSPKDDFGFILNITAKEGFFTSNRDGGKGFDDIYGFKEVMPVIVECVQKVDGIVRDKNTNAIIANAKVVLIGDAMEVLVETTSDQKGYFDLGIIKCEKTYTARASKENYNIAEETFNSTTELDLSLSLEIGLTSKIVAPVVSIGTDLTVLLDLDNINFDYDKSFIRPDAAAILQRVVNYMKKFPTVKIDVRSHTDSRGRDSYNESLSERRNISTRKWLVEKGGIKATRLSGKGYGETRLVNQCSNGVTCSDQEHELNRRSEFIVVSK
ncbi:cell envelope biogenesis protein OmpA [Patiriisocius marinus]|uniref:Cell envelope biogenesis protein OmpA n=1 Tax=Patiriisocius marinus TaxID=1397112 RepID=A0A5J4IRN8_9FLAO|nr:OmpA family protein [Patiriisocius marinus]GER60595.1 cell envelope biogenesis protein OmpA [Patiriisocius marinus]